MVKYSFKNAVALVLAGGRSERLFPLSVPKPLLEIKGRSLLEWTLARLSSFKEVRVVCNAEVAGSIRAYFRKKGKAVPQFILEPEPRDTAAAVGYALRSLRKHPPEWVGIFSADQFFIKGSDFRVYLRSILKELNDYSDHLFLAGSSASTKSPETHSQFGWMRRESASKTKSYLVKRFVEKPDAKTLTTLRKSGALINCGMFFGAFSVFEEAFSRYFPEVLNKDVKFSDLPRLPIDRAIFEKFPYTRVLPMELKWEDLGTWEAVSRYQDSKSHHYSSDHSSFIYGADGSKEIYVLGDERLGVVELNDRLAIFPLNRSHEMKDFLKRIKKLKRP